MTVHTVTRRGERRLVIDILYKTANGESRRYRRDAQVQTRTAALAEERRLVAQLVKTGDIPTRAEDSAMPAAVAYTFADAVRHFRATRMPSAFKPSTRHSYGQVLDTVLVPRFGARKLADVANADLSGLDAELVAEGLKPSTRRNVHVVFRSVLRWAVEAGLMAVLPPRLPPLPKVGRTVVRSMQQDDLEALLRAASPAGQLAFALAAYAGLRASEVRGLRWSDVDFATNTLVVRRAICRGIESTPKSHHQRPVPLATPLRARLEVASRTKNSPWSAVALTKHGKPWGSGGLHQVFERAQARAKLTGWSFHSLRHFFVTELFRRGASAPVVQQLAGHADLATTQRYADMAAGDLRSAIGRLG